MVDRPVVFTIHGDESLLVEVRKSAASVGAGIRNFDSAAEFLSLGADLHGCLICAHRLKERSAVELLETMRMRGYCLPMIIITQGAETRTITQSMQRGAFTVMDDSYSNDELWDTIRRAIELDRDNRRSMAACVDFDRRLGSLARKERQVLDLIIGGHANKVIAKRLGVSVRTVESRRHAIFKNTVTKSLAELVALVYRHEL